MNQTQKHWSGIDVAKKTFDASIAHPGQYCTGNIVREMNAERFSRDTEGVERFLTWVRAELGETELASARAVMEATGAYSTELYCLLVAGCPSLRPAIVNPERAHAFANSIGLRNYTDPICSRALAFYGAERKPAPYEPLTPQRQELRDLSRHRDILIAAKVADDNRSEQPFVNKKSRSMQAKEYRVRLANIGILEKEMKRVIEASPEFARDYDLLVSIPGVGFITAVLILAEVGDLRRFERAKQAAAFVGLSPRQTTSGTSVNKKPRLCKKGSPRVRQGLYLAAMSAIRCEGPLQKTYEDLCGRGKTRMSALGAIMRKMLVLMRAIVIGGKPFDKMWKNQRIPAV